MSGRSSLLIVVCLLVCNSQAFFVGNSTPSPLLNPAASSFLPVNITGSAPLARTGAVLGSSALGFVLLGGSVPFGDHYGWAFNGTGSSWTKLKTQFAIAGACSVQNENSIWIYGGSDTTPNTDLYRYDIDTDTLVNMNVTGTHPTQGVSCGWRNDTIYLFGGNNKAGALTISRFHTTAAEKKWDTVSPSSTDNPANTVGASGLVFGDEFVLWGGSADANVWRFNLKTLAWSVDKTPNGKKPDARSYHSAAVDTIAPTDSFIIFGGSIYGTFTLHNDSWIYNLPNMTWTLLEPRALQGTPPPREMANSIYTKGRFFIFSGAVTLNDTVNDFWQLVVTMDCYDRTDCDECVNVSGCGWCGANTPGFQCLPGTGEAAYIMTDCNADFSTDLTICPPDGFPGWIIALIIVAAILMIGIVWYLVIRCQKKSGGYEQIN